ncbi:MAG: hypothetical protein ACE5GZ_08325 [Gammaproteobacteria bacterium]
MVGVCLKRVIRVKEIRFPFAVLGRTLLFLNIVLLSSSCSTVTTYTPDGKPETRSLEEFRAYAEQVFRRQNHASSEIIMLQLDAESEDNDQYSRLMNAEEKIIDACSPLNRMAARMAENRKINPSLKYEIFYSLSKCDHVTRDVETLIKSYSM